MICYDLVAVIWKLRNASILSTKRAFLERQDLMVEANMQILGVSMLATTIEKKSAGVALGYRFNFKLII